MPTYVLDEYRADIPRNAVLVDTNILSARFLPRDDFHIEASYFLDTVPSILVPLCVIGEAWGIVNSRARSAAPAIEMLRWVSTPGTVTVVRDDEHLSSRSNELCSNLGIDYVDAMLMLLADKLSRECLGRRIKIATLDTRDFYRLMRARTHQFELCDMRSWDGDDL